MAGEGIKSSDQRFSLDSALSGFSPFISAGISDQKKPQVLKPHSHDGYELTYLARGEVTWEVEQGRDLVLRGGDMAITMPRVLHKGKFEIIQPSQLFWVIFNLKSTPEKGSALTREELSSMDSLLEATGNSVVRASAFMRELFAQLFSAAQKLDAGNEICAAHVRALAMAMLMECAACLAGKNAIRRFNRFSSAIHYINENLDSEISIDTLAKLSGLGRSRFFEAFQHQTGMTPSHYIMRARCEKASSLLAQTDMSITSIALDLGFSSSQYFASCFKNFSGMAPSSFRKRAQESGGVGPGLTQDISA